MISNGRICGVNGNLNTVDDSNEGSGIISREVGLTSISFDMKLLLSMLTWYKWQHGCYDRYIVRDSEVNMGTVMYHHRLLHAGYIFTNYEMMMIHIPISISSIIDTYMDVYIDDCLMVVGKFY